MYSYLCCLFLVEDHAHNAETAGTFPDSENPCPSFPEAGAGGQLPWSPFAKVICGGMLMLTSAGWRGWEGMAASYTYTVYIS